MAAAWSSPNLLFAIENLETSRVVRTECGFDPCLRLFPSGLGTAHRLFRLVGAGDDPAAPVLARFGTDEALLFQSAQRAVERSPVVAARRREIAERGGDGPLPPAEKQDLRAREPHWRTRPSIPSAVQPG